MTKANDTEWFDINIEQGEDEQARLAKVLDRVEEVCPVPATSQHVMSLTQRDDAMLGPVVEAVARDPAIAAEVLRIANSPIFGRSRQISDLKRAVVAIGMRELHHMAAAMAMLAAFPKEGELSLQLHGTAVLSATFARLLTTKVGGMDPKDAFMAGLLCEIGAMACISVDGKHYMALWTQCAGDANQRSVLETARYGAPSEFIGAQMLARNQIPSTVTSAVAGSIIMPAEALQPSQRITAMARSVAPLIVRAVNEQNLSILQNDIPALARQLGFTGLSQPELASLCLDSGQTAELTLRGELSMLAEAASEPTAPEPEPVRPPQAVASPPKPVASPAAEPAKERGVMSRIKGWFGKG
ncbi:MAG: HDOD domain-containing protein [Myxococcota bacterium]|jgi:HD-like signal output (HDOD) protein|nr:HDOD domain-containing protein [Myxococcota bacterium]